jgi:hypothetical protein
VKTIRYAAFLLTVATSLHVFALETPSHLQVVRDNPDGCVSTPIAYGASSRGTLGVSDCTFSDGTYYDRYTFTGFAGDRVVISLRPLSASLTNPKLVLAPPSNDASTPPQIFGQTASQLNYKLSSTGTWAFAVGTNDVFGSGSYFVKLSRVSDDSPGEPQSCVTQYLQCHQTGYWFLTSQSCRFINDPGFVYASFLFYGIAGDAVSFTMASSTFGPQANLFSDVKNDYIGTAHFPDAFTSTDLEILPATGYYEIIASSRDPGKVGFFTLKLDCTTSGCVPPLFVAQPFPARVVSGTNAFMFATANGTAPIAINWSDPFTGETLGSGSSIVISRITSSSSIYAHASNACGSDQSDLATITVLQQHRRAVSH